MIPILVVSTMSGLVLSGEVLVNARSAPGRGVRVEPSLGQLVGAWWCPDPGPAECMDDSGGGCPFDEGHHEVLLYAGPGGQVRVSCATVLAWSGVTPGGGMAHGVWAGPADWNLDGLIDSRDFFDMLSAWFAHDARADFDADGELLAHDIIAFIDAFGPPE